MRAEFVLSDEIRKAFKKIYRTGERDRDKQAEFVFKALHSLGFVSKENLTRVFLDYIKRMILLLSKPHIRRDPEVDPEYYQLHLWEDLDQVLAVQRADGKTEGVELGDFGLAEVEARTQQIRVNREHVIAEERMWLRACEFIRPLLEANPDWCWRDAVDHMRETGGLPDL